MTIGLALVAALAVLPTDAIAFPPYDFGEIIVVVDPPTVSIDLTPYHPTTTWFMEIYGCDNEGDLGNWSVMQAVASLTIPGGVLHAWEWESWLTENNWDHYAFYYITGYSTSWPSEYHSNDWWEVGFPAPIGGRPEPEPTILQTSWAVPLCQMLLVLVFLDSLVGWFKNERT